MILSKIKLSNKLMQDINLILSPKIVISKHKDIFDNYEFTHLKFKKCVKL